jgi:hypothetical protein
LADAKITFEELIQFGEELVSEEVSEYSPDNDMKKSIRKI